ncbi:MAG: T9SS type A sorting domain-containing protein [Sphingobacteriales bacterium]|nr:MAG: T9SS type A sorting domain-containing protein [Sphingobacteriales bacterium]
MCTLTANSDGSWNGYMEVTVQGTGSGGTAIGHVEKENSKQFHLGQNYPNPHRGVTTVPFSLVNTSKVTFDVFDLQGRKVSTMEQGTLSPGEHTVVLNLSYIGISQGNYVYQIQVENSDGVFRLCKMMTAAK